jgi:hypothetical protein
MLTIYMLTSTESQSSGRLADGLLDQWPARRLMDIVLLDGFFFAITESQQRGGGFPIDNSPPVGGVFAITYNASHYMIYQSCIYAH